MIVHPELAALRGDDTPQRNAQAIISRAFERWRFGPEIANVFADMDAWDKGRPFSECGALTSLFEGESASAWRLADGFAMAMAAAMRTEPLAHVPIRHFTDGLVSTLMLARSGSATLSLTALDGAELARRPQPATACFEPLDSCERVLAGSARADLVECRSMTRQTANLRIRTVGLHPGAAVFRDAERQALIVRQADGCLVTLRLQRRRKGPGATREYRLANGALVHLAAGSRKDSRTELMLALLGRMGRDDAAPHAKRIALGSDSEALRWQALRECLALDTATGFSALLELAERLDDSLAPHARMLRDQLVAAHPRLAELTPCPA